MRMFGLISLLLTVALAWSSDSALGSDEVVNDPEAAARFRAFCDARLRRIREHYERCSYEVQSVTIRGGRREQLTQSMATAGDGYTLSRMFVPNISSDTEVPEFREGESLGEISARMTSILNQKYFANIGIDSTGKPILRELIPAEPVFARGEESVCFACPVPGARIPFDDLAHDSETYVGEFDEVVTPTGTVLKLVASFPAKRMERFGRLICEAKFDPNFGQCVSCKVLIGNSGSSPEFIYEYDQTGDHLPILRSTTMVEKSREIVVKSTYRNFVFGTTPPKEQCYLSYYGLPEPPDPDGPIDVGIPAWLWALTLGLVLLAASVWLRRRNRQQT